MARGKMEQTAKTQAMMAARLIADIDNAVILDGAMVRAATEAALQLQQWTTIADNLEEVSNATSIAIERLLQIERKAKSIQSNPIIDDVLVGLHCAIMGLRIAARRKLTSPGKAGVEEEYDDMEDEFTADESEPHGVVYAEEELMPKDLRLAMEKVTQHFYILLVLLVAIMTTSSVIIIFYYRDEFLDNVAKMERETTLSLTLVAQTTLDMLYDAMVAAGEDIHKVGLTTAASVLADMTSKVDTAQEMKTQSTDYVTEYRGAVQDFANGKQVTSVVTARSFGGICHTNETYPIHRINDIEANQSYVVPLLTPNACGNDATSTGIFSTVVPSYFTYAEYVVTYRRTLARLGTFYHEGFGLSIAVTHDRVSLQDYLTPPVSLIGRMQTFASDQQLWEKQLALWTGLTMLVIAWALFLSLTCMFHSRLTYWRIIYTIITAMVMMMGTNAVHFVSQAVFSAAMNTAMQRTTSSLLMGTTGALFSRSVQQYDIENRLFTRFAEDLFPGELFATDVGATTIIPANMRSVAHHINAKRISRYRRGSYTGLEYGYAVSSSYMYSKGWNFVLAKKTPPLFRADSAIAILAVSAIIDAAVVYSYLRFSPLSRLRQFGLGSPILRYRFEPASLRYVTYGLTLLLSLVGMACVNIYGVSEVSRQMTLFSQDSLVLLGGCLRGSGIVDLCTDNCGMPDFNNILYFVKTPQAGSSYPLIQFVDQNIPLPYPLQPHWAYYYLGAQLAVNNIHTTLVNVPSFSTPMVNRTNNVTNPINIVRHMMSTSGINASVGFVQERFPDSYYPTAYSFNSHSIGIAVMVITCAIVIVVSELEYMTLHEAYKKGGKLPWRPFIVMGLVQALVPLAFVAHGAFMEFELRNELHEFAKQELAFVGGAVGYRLGIIALSMSDVTQEEIITALVAAAWNSSVSAMLIGNVFFRVRIATETARGSGEVVIHSVIKNDPIVIGSLDQGFVPVCGRFDAAYVSDHSEGEMNYCYSEIPQNSNADSPRIFVLATSGHRLWVDLPTMHIWALLFGVSAMVGSFIACVLGLTLYMTLYTAHGFGFPLLNTRELLPFTEPLPRRFSKEYFMPRGQRQYWVCSTLVLGIFILYYAASVGEFFFLIREARRVSVSYQTQTSLFLSVTTKAITDAYNFILFPFPAHTLKPLMQMSIDAADGTLEYQFITKEGLETFQTGIINTYLNLSGTNNILNSMLGAANSGYGSFCSLIASQYEALYISNQEATFEALTTLATAVKTEIDNPANSVVNCVSCMGFLHELAIYRDLMRKLFILDHLAIASYANFAYTSSTAWPFHGEDELTIISATRSLVEGLETLVAASVVRLNALMVASAPAAKNTLVDLLDEVTESYAASYAVRSFTSTVWTTQLKRCEEAVSVGNVSQQEIATTQQGQEVTSIGYLSGNLTDALGYELTARKTYQMMEYIRTGQPLSNEFAMQAWQRWNSLKQIKRMYNICFACTFSCFLSVGVCIVLHFKMLRRKTELVQQEIDRNAILRQRHAVASTSRSPSHSADLQKDYSGTKLEAEFSGTHSSFLEKNDTPKEQESVTMKGKGTSGVQEPSSPPPGGVKHAGEPLTPSDTSASVPPPRHQRWVSVPVALFVLLTVIPIVCSFWMLVLSHSFVYNELDSIGIVLSLYSKVNAIFDNLNLILEKSVLFYLGDIEQTDLMDFMNEMQQMCDEVSAAFRWDLATAQEEKINNLMNAFTLVYNTLLSEILIYGTVVPSTEVSNYYYSQSAYARDFLPKLTSENTYGKLLPVSATTDGSAMHTFAEAYYEAKKAAVAGIDKTTFRMLYAEYALVVDAMDSAAEAELMMWHATVAGAREEGYTIATNYGDFSSYLSSSALAAITTSTNPSGTAAVDEVNAYYKDLMTSYGSAFWQLDLFENTMNPPSGAATSSLGAYEAAGYVSSYLSSTTTQAKFSNMFGYNRNLTASSSALQGQPPLVTYINEFNDALRALFLSLGNGALQASPARINKWIWYTEVRLNPVFVKDHEDLDYLGYAIRWCCIVSFWGLLFSAGGVTPGIHGSCSNVSTYPHQRSCVGAGSPALTCSRAHTIHILEYNSPPPCVASLTSTSASIDTLFPFSSISLSSILALLRIL
eukprot:gene793-435_t